MLSGATLLHETQLCMHQAVKWFLKWVLPLKLIFSPILSTWKIVLLQLCSTRDWLRSIFSSPSAQKRLHASIDENYTFQTLPFLPNYRHCRLQPQYQHFPNFPFSKTGFWEANIDEDAKDPMNTYAIWMAFRGTSSRHTNVSSNSTCTCPLLT